MASSDTVLSSRKLIRIGDIEDNRPNSEAVNAILAGVSNFISSYQTDYINFFLNGSYRVATGIIGYDGAYTCFHKSEIVGVQIWNAIAGTSGVTEFDVRWLNTSGADMGSIFSVTPKITSAAPSPARGFRNLESGNDFTLAGLTLPTLSKTTFEEGETLYLVLNSAMVSAQNAALTINIRPIT